MEASPRNPAVLAHIKTRATKHLDKLSNDQKRQILLKDGTVSLSKLKRLSAMSFNALVRDMNMKGGEPDEKLAAEVAAMRERLTRYNAIAAKEEQQRLDADRQKQLEAKKREEMLERRAEVEAVRRRLDADRQKQLEAKKWDEMLERRKAADAYRIRLQNMEKAKAEKNAAATAAAAAAEKAEAQTAAAEIAAKLELKAEMQRLAKKQEAVAARLANRVEEAPVMRNPSAAKRSQFAEEKAAMNRRLLLASETVMNSVAASVKKIPTPTVNSPNGRSSSLKSPTILEMRKFNDKPVKNYDDKEIQAVYQRDAVEWNPNPITYETINGFLHQNNIRDNTSILNESPYHYHKLMGSVIEALDKMMKPGENDVVLYRGISKTRIESIQKGVCRIGKAYTSTTSNPFYAAKKEFIKEYSVDWGEYVLLQLHVPGYIKRLVFENDTEAEVLLQRNTVICCTNKEEIIVTHPLDLGGTIYNPSYRVIKCDVKLLEFPPKAPVFVSNISPDLMKNFDITDIANWKITGDQRGSNPGGFYTDTDEITWYVKVPDVNEHADADEIVKNEMLANMLYKEANIRVPECKFIMLEGHLGIASKVIPINDTTQVSLTTSGVKEGYAVDAWLANHDVVGAAFDNMVVGTDGHAIRIDNGGALLYRAQGARKGFGVDVTEIDSYKQRGTAGQLFKGISNADVIASIVRVLSIDDARISELCTMYGPGSLRRRRVLAEKLIERKRNLRLKQQELQKLKLELNPRGGPRMTSCRGGPRRTSCQ